VQRLATAPAAPASPRADPRFAAVESKVAGAARTLRAHPAPAAEVRKAQAAAAPASGERLAGAQERQAAAMGAAQPGVFDKAGFVAAVTAAIAAKAPANLDEAEGFATSGKAEQVKEQVAGRAQAGAHSSAAAITGATAAAPDPSAVPEKSVTPLPPERTPAPPSIDMAGAVPARAPPAATDMSAGARETEGAMSAAGVTQEQLAGSNEPELVGALDAKRKGEEHSATAPAQVRAAEAEHLGQATAGAQLAGRAGLAGMLGARAGSNARATATKSGAKADDEAARAEVATHIQSIFTTTKAETQAILTALDTSVAAKFDQGEKQAREAFRAEHTAAMAKYKDERYSGLSGAAAWVRDKFAGLPAEANAIFVTARGHYTQAMDGVISAVADHIGAELGRARERIATGRRQIDEYVASRPRALRAVATQAAQATAAGFEQLEGEVDSKKDALVDDLAAKYTEARDAVDAEIKTAQEENTGLWDAAKAAIGGAIETIGKLKDMLLGVLARAAGAVGRIIADPIGFLGKFVNAIKAGIVGFSTNIVEHLKKGLQGWLLGALAAGGIQLPEKFDLRGIIGLVLSILGLTWANIRARIVRKIPERVMGAVEKSVGFIQVLLSEGVPGLWKWVAAKVNDLKEMVMGQVREFVVTKIVKAGITWLIALLNPAAAFIKACKMIYDVVMFFVEKAAQIKEFVDAVLDSVESILGGGVGAVANLIEGALAKMLPVILSFLASLLGLGGISEKIQQILKTVQKPVMSVIDKLVAGAVKVGKKLMGKIRGGKKGEDATQPPAGEVKQEALEKGAAAVVGANSLPAVRSALGTVAGTLKPRGLKSLEAHVSEDGAQLVLVAKASPAESRSVKFDDVIQGADQLKKYMTGGEKHPTTGRAGYVAASLVVDGVQLATAFNEKQSGNPGDTTHHAEQMLLGQGALTGAAAKAAANARKAGSSKVNLLVSTAPCRACSAALSTALKGAKAGLPVDVRDLIGFHLLSTRVYEAAGKTDDAKGWQKHKELSTTNAAVRLLQSAGWDQAQLDVGKETARTKIWAQYLGYIAQTLKPTK
jgi:hypothetical protein